VFAHATHRTAGHVPTRAVTAIEHVVLAVLFHDERRLNPFLTIPVVNTFSHLRVASEKLSGRRPRAIGQFLRTPVVQYSADSRSPDTAPKVPVSVVAPEDVVIDRLKPRLPSYLLLGIGKTVFLRHSAGFTNLVDFRLCLGDFGRNIVAGRRVRTDKPPVTI